jgi:acyl carrier protein
MRAVQDQTAEIAEIAKAVRGLLEARHLARGANQPLPEDPAVFDDGLLDSLGLAELITLVEQRIARPVDMLRFDALAVHSQADLVQELAGAAGLTAGA